MAQKSISTCGMGTVNSVRPPKVTVLPIEATASSTSSTTAATTIWGMAAEELCRFFALCQQTGQCQHDGRGGAQARVHFLFPAGTQTRHKQVG